MKQKKVLVKIMFSVFSKRLCFFTVNFLVVLFISSILLFSQTSAKKYKLGALPITKEEYDKFPKPNWDTLRKYSNQKTFTAKSTLSVKMLTAPPIGDQGSEGSCVGWATGYTALGILTYPKYNCWDIARRSPNYVYNQIRLGVGCDTGTYITYGLDLVKAQGSCSWSIMPYIDGICSVMPNSTQIYDASKHNALNWAALTTTDVESIKSALDLGYPLVVGIDIYDSFFTMWGNGGIWTSTSSGFYYGRHAVCIVGYDDVQRMFKVQNQWGTTGGDQGYFWVTYNLVTNNCLQ